MSEPTSTQPVPTPVTTSGGETPAPTPPRRTRKPLNAELLTAIVEVLERKRPNGMVVAEIWNEVEGKGDWTRRQVQQMLAAQAKRTTGGGPAADRVLGLRRIRRNGQGEYTIVHTRPIKRRRRAVLNENGRSVDIEADSLDVDAEDLLSKGTQLEVIMAHGDEAIVKAGGAIYRILWERLSD